MPEHITCARCGKEYTPQSQFCPFCGTTQIAAHAKPKRAGCGKNVLIIIGVLIALGVIGNALSHRDKTSQNWISSAKPTPVQVVDNLPTTASIAQASNSAQTTEPLATSTRMVPAATTAPTSTPVPPTRSGVPATINADALNVRSGPGTGFDVLGTLHRGDALTVTGKNADASWYNVAVSTSLKGWASAPLISLSGSDSGLTVVPAAEEEPMQNDTRSQPTAVPVPAVEYKGLLGRIWTGVKVYYGLGPTKTLGFTILGGAENCDIAPSGRVVYVEYPDGTKEWKDREALLDPPFFSRADDPAVKQMGWYVYPCVH